MRAINLAVGERCERPIFVAADGRRIDRHAAGRIVRRIARRAGIAKRGGSSARSARELAPERATCLNLVDAWVGQPWVTNLKGNRKLNHAIHMAAITQIRNSRSPGRAYYDRKLTETKTNKEALARLKRRISDVIYRQLVPDAEHEAGPGGQTGTTLQSSVTGPTPTAGSSDKPQPGPEPGGTRA